MRETPRKLRVLHVPDVISWVTWMIAEQYARHCPWAESTICSVLPLRDLIETCGGYPGEVDLVHFRTSADAPLLLDHFEGRVPCVASIHHVEGEWCWAAERRCDAVTTEAVFWYRHLTGLG